MLPTVLAVHDAETDVDALTNEIVDLHPAERAHEDFADDIRSQLERSGPTFQLVTLDLTTLDGASMTDEQIVARYAEQGAAGMPPIVLACEFGCPDPGLIILDGAHRVQSARLRGDTAIDAWVPEDQF